MHSTALSKYENVLELHPVLGHRKEQESIEYPWQRSRSQMSSHRVALQHCLLEVDGCLPEDVTSQLVRTATWSKLCSVVLELIK